jgi:LuxR family maltose regulon positive regulatory protein
VAALEARSEGWVASLQLAALAAQTQAPAPNQIGPAALPQAALAGGHRFLVDYLAEQVLLQQPPEVQAFLIATAPLERLCAPLCAAVWGAEAGSAQALLDYLDRANLFLTPLDDQRQWYRYHPLFAEFLQARLRQEPAERSAALNQRAAEWCAQHQFMEDAVRYALAARDYDRATQLIEAVAETLWGRSQILTMRGWLHAMPADLVRAQPRLGLQMAWAHAIYGQLDEVEPVVAAAVAQLGPPPPAPAAPLSEEAWHGTEAWLHTQARLIRAFIARFRGGAAETAREAQRALALIPPNCPRPQSIAYVLLGHAYLLLGQTEQADAALAQAVATSAATRNAAAYVSAINYLALLRLMQGRLRAAIELYRAALAWVDEEREPSSGGAERIGLGTLLREQNELEAAEALIEAGVQRAEAGGDFTFLRDGYVARARLAQARGAWDQALASMAQAEAVARRSTTNTDGQLLAAWRARICLAQGDVRAAGAWAAGSGLRVDDPPEFLQEYGHLTLARVLLAQGQARAAEALLARLWTAAEAAGRAGRLIEIGAVQALAQQALGRPEAAQAALGRALALAAPEGFVRVFADEGEAMAALLAGVRGEHRAYAARLSAACLETARAANPARAGDARPVLAGTATRPLRAPEPAAADYAEPLSERELSVLRLIVAGLSNHDIAEALVVAPSTIQWHVKNIYSKLAVHSRTQAALAARELGLVS